MLSSVALDSLNRQQLRSFAEDLLGRVQAPEREINGVASSRRRYYISSLQADAQRM